MEGGAVMELLPSTSCTTWLLKQAEAMEAELLAFCERKWEYMVHRKVGAKNVVLLLWWWNRRISHLRRHGI